MTEDNQDVIFRKLIDEYLKDDTHFFIKAFKKTCRNKNLSRDDLEVLKHGLGEKIVEQVERVDRTKPILLIGSNDALVKGTLALIWNTQPLIPKGKPLLGSGNDRVYFVDKNCSGLTEDEIGKDLFHSPEKRPDENDLVEVMHQRTLFKRKMSECLKPLMNLYNNLCILSLRGLESKQHENILKRIIAEVEERKGNNEEGCLIVSIDGINTLPQEISRQFDPIYLEPKKQDIPASTPQDTAKQAKFIPFPTPSGTQWHEVGISFIDSENVKISARDKTATKHFFDMGFRKGKTCKPVKSWHTLFAFSEKRCLKYSQAIKSKTEKDIQDLRKRLKAYFGIQDDPIIFDHGYEPVFKVCGSESEGEGRSVRAFSNSAIFDEKEND